jgi:hypothetical protein
LLKKLILNLAKFKSFEKSPELESLMSCHVTILMTFAVLKSFFLIGTFSKQGTIAGTKTLFFDTCTTQHSQQLSRQ